jgi:hypothetical protein
MDLDEGIFPKFFYAPQGFHKNIICHAKQCILCKIIFGRFLICTTN